MINQHIKDSDGKKKRAINYIATIYIYELDQVTLNRKVKIIKNWFFSDVKKVVMNK